jgi:outer membrane receptor for ferrienterochelin and colicins
MCKSRIEKTASKVKGVTDAAIDLKAQKLTIKTNKDFSKQVLIDALLNVGHDTDGQKASDAAYEKLHECCHYRDAGQGDDDPKTEPITATSNTNALVKIKVSGTCEMCTDRIEATASNIIGVNSAVYDLETQILTLVTQQFFEKKELINALLAAGHDSEGQVAPDNIYKSLPACCLYRDQPKDASANTLVRKTITGVVQEKGFNSSQRLPVIGAIVSTQDGNHRVLSDENGQFSLDVSADFDSIRVSYIGYETAILKIPENGVVDIVLTDEPLTLAGVEIIYRKKSTEVSFLDPIKTQKISSKELLKAACCNLAESFDTTPAIDASFTDAVTGTRKIEMLGLAGPYVQITRENIPDVRGLAAIQGLSYTPGPWVEGMQLNMGAGSVVNGFEAITGQINVELRKPCHEDQLYLNAYAGQGGRLEMNSFNKNTLSENWSTSNLLHLSTRVQRRDHNHDGFLDMPLGKQLGYINRWKWTNNDGQEAQIGAKLTLMDMTSGQKDFDPVRSDRTKVWGADMGTTRVELWGKRGFVNLDKPERTLGFQASAVYHDQKSQFGLRRYDAIQKSAYFNSIHQNYIGNIDHQVRVGASLLYDNYTEDIGTLHYDREEIVPGVFGEYTYKGSQKYTILIGGRADYHNNYGLFFTPRLNVRVAPTEKTVWRLSAGRGQKTASIFAENIGILASNREIIVRSENTINPYGLRPEVAWNFGTSLTQEFTIGKLPFFVSLDANRVQFENQIVVDLENPRQVSFYNLVGQSFANSAQILLESSLTKWLDIRLAYRYNDVKTTFGENLLRKPLTSPQRAFVNLEMKLGRGWTFDYTINRLSSIRIPSTEVNPVAYKWDTQSPAFYLSNTQITKSWKNGFDVYVGGENIFDYKLHRPIIASDQPFSKYFDSSLAWGPIMGVNIHVGIRYALKAIEK